MTDKLEEVITIAFRIFDEKTTCKVRDLADEQGEEAVRNLLRENGIQSLKTKNQYLKYLEEVVELILED